MVALVMLSACTPASPAEVIAGEPTASVTNAPAAEEAAQTESVPATEEPAMTTEPETDGQTPIFENEFVRIFFTEYAPDDGTITLRVENLTKNTILILTPLDRSNEIGDAADSLLVDGTPHMAVRNSNNTVSADSFCNYKMTAATGPDAQGYLSIDPLDANAKTAEFVQEFFLSDENENELAAIMLPVIDLTAPSYFPLPSISNFSATTLSGEPIDGSYFSAHKLTMVNFWATWCGPCVDEMPDISALHEEYADQGFAVLGVLVWDEGSEQSALDFLTSSGIVYPVVAYDTVPAFVEIAATQGAIPFTVFIDSEGNQVGDVMVGSRSKDGWAAEIETLLQQVG